MTSAENLTFTVGVINGYLYAECEDINANFAGRIPDEMANVILDTSLPAKIRLTDGYTKLEYTVTSVNQSGVSTTYVCILEEDPLKLTPRMNKGFRTDIQKMAIDVSNGLQQLRIESHLRRTEAWKLKRQERDAQTKEADQRVIEADKEDFLKSE
jgi:hypothetical protein